MVEDFSNRKTSNAKSAVLKNAIKIARILHFIKRVFNSLHTVCFEAHNFAFIFHNIFCEKNAKQDIEKNREHIIMIFRLIFGVLFIFV